MVDSPGEEYHSKERSYAITPVTVAHYKSANWKREQFQRYLEKSGVLDTLTKVWVALYKEPEKPSSALDFSKHHLGAATPENPEIELLHLELAEMKEKYEATIEDNKKLKAKCAQYEPPHEEKCAE
ncbi:C-Myc-binding protein-like [Heterocephalus glaber]|nr:C-Myc-binding protein-like [Heterocephalus glaber]